MQTPPLLQPTDARLQHLGKQHGITFNRPLLDCSRDIVDIFRHQDDVVQVCESARLQIESSLTIPAHAVQFDAGLDGQCRLEALLLQRKLHYPRSTFPDGMSVDDVETFQQECRAGAAIIIVASERPDGSDSLEELGLLIRKTYDTQLRCNGQVVGHDKIRIVESGMQRLDGRKEAEDEMVEDAERVAHYIKRRPFVFHCNTSATMLDKLLQHSVAKYLRGVTMTCDVVAETEGVITGTNAKLDKSAWLRCIERCRELGVPFLSVHGSMSGLAKQTLGQLDGWPAAMLRPVPSMVYSQYIKQTIRSRMGMCLLWTGRSYSLAKKCDGATTRAFIRDQLAQRGYLPRNDYRTSDEWAKLPLWKEAEFERLSPHLAGHDLREMSYVVNCPLSSMIGNMSACCFDIPSVRDEAVVVLKVAKLQEEDSDRWSLTVGGGGGGGGGTHYILAYANEKATLDASWDLVRYARSTHTGNASKLSFPIIDAQLAKEFVDLARIMTVMLTEVLDNISSFPPGSETSVHEALVALQDGEMIRRCKSGVQAS